MPHPADGRHDLPDGRNVPQHPVLRSIFRFLAESRQQSQILALSLGVATVYPWPLPLPGQSAKANRTGTASASSTETPLRFATIAAMARPSSASKAPRKQAASESASRDRHAPARLELARPQRRGRAVVRVGELLLKIGQGVPCVKSQQDVRVPIISVSWRCCSRPIAVVIG